MFLRQLFDGPSSTFTYLLADRATGQALLIDPVLEQIERDLRLIGELDFELSMVLDTHVHADHVTAAGHLRDRTGAESVSAEAAHVGCATRHVHQGDRLQVGDVKVEVRSTPGHTAGCLSYVVQAPEQTMVFTGDALLIRGTGRTDFQGGDSAALYRSIHSQLFTLPDETIVYPAHDYRGHTCSTIGEERRHNPRIHTGVSEQEFIKTMANLDLPIPGRMKEVLPKNMSCGKAPQIADPDLILQGG